MIDEKYYICTDCATLATQTEINEQLEGGGQGFCDCNYAHHLWDSNIKNFDVWFPREYIDYTEISKGIYESLKEEENNIKRIQMFETIPINELMEE